jgi:hypothetical protein
MNPWNDFPDNQPPTTGHSEEYLVELKNGDHVVANWMNIGGWDFEPESLVRYWMQIPHNTKCNGCGCPIEQDSDGYCAMCD